MAQQREMVDLIFYINKYMYVATDTHFADIFIRIDNNHRDQAAMRTLDRDNIVFIVDIYFQCSAYINNKCGLYKVNVCSQSS